MWGLRQQNQNTTLTLKRELHYLEFQIQMNFLCYNNQVMNEFKAGFFMNPNDLHRHRLAATQKQLTEFWLSKTLLQLQRILCIKDQYLIYEIIYEQYLKYYLNNKKISLGQVFHVMLQDQILMYVYDAKIFRSQAYEKYQNDLISTFLIAFKSKNDTPNDQIFEFLDYDIVKEQEWILKVKESALLRIFPFIIHRFLQKRQSNLVYQTKNSIGGSFLSKQPDLYREVVILDPKIYFYYVYAMLPKYQFNPQLSIKTVFELIADLMYNNFLIAWYQSLSEEERYERHFKRFFRLIPKPRIKQQFTSIDNKFTQIKWQTFKISVFKLKYLIKQTQSNYQCYQIQQRGEQKLSQPYEQLSVQDENILKAFQKQRVSSPNYDQEYTYFYENVQPQT